MRWRTSNPVVTCDKGEFPSLSNLHCMAFARAVVLDEYVTQQTLGSGRTKLTKCCRIHIGIGPNSSLIRYKSHLCGKRIDQKHARSDRRCGFSCTSRQLYLSSHRVSWVTLQRLADSVWKVHYSTWRLGSEGGRTPRTPGRLDCRTSAGQDLVQDKYRTSTGQIQDNYRTTT